jgi:hypothetical protein
VTDDLRAKIAEVRIAKGRQLLERYDDACQRAAAAQDALSEVDRAIGTMQQPHVHARLIDVDHPRSVGSEHVARNELRLAHEAVDAWCTEADEDGREFGALRALFAASIKG